MPIGFNNSEPETQGTTHIWRVLEALPKATSGEVETKTISEWVKTGHGYLCDVDAAFAVKEHYCTCQAFLKACRVSYIILPEHSRCAQMKQTDSAVVPMKKLRQSIQSTYEEISDFISTKHLMTVAGELRRDSETLPMTKRSTPPPSPSTSTSTYANHSRANSNASNSPGINDSPLAPTLPDVVAPGNADDDWALNLMSTFMHDAAQKRNTSDSIDTLSDDEETAYYSATMFQTDPTVRSLHPLEDTFNHDTAWKVHSRETDPKLFAGIYEEMHSQSSSNGPVNLETGGGRDSEMFSDTRNMGPFNPSNSNPYPSPLIETDIECIESLVPPGNLIPQSQNPLFNTLAFASALADIDYDEMISLDDSRRHSAPQAQGGDSPYANAKQDKGKQKASSSPSSPSAPTQTSTAVVGNTQEVPIGNIGTSVPAQNAGRKFPIGAMSRWKTVKVLQPASRHDGDDLSRSLTSPAIFKEQHQNVATDISNHFNRPQDVNLAPMTTTGRRESNRAEAAAAETTANNLFNRNQNINIQQMAASDRRESNRNEALVHTTASAHNEQGRRARRLPSAPPHLNHARQLNRSSVPMFLPFTGIFSTAPPSPKPAKTHNRRPTIEPSVAQTTSNPSSPRVVLVPGAQTGDRVDPNMRVTPTAVNTTTAVHHPSNRSSPRHSPIPSPQTDASQDRHNTPATTPSPGGVSDPRIIERLRLHARTNLELVQCMTTFSAMVSYTSDLFTNMRMYAGKNDYVNAYIYGTQGMIMATYILPQHSECRPDSGPSYYRYVEITEMNQFRNKELLRNIETKLEQQHNK